VTLAVEINPLPLVHALRATADVHFVDEAPGFQASVFLAPGAVAVARLGYALIGSLSEGRVLREVMLKTAGSGGCGLFLWINDSLLCLTP
jgi:hypothetical protein